MGGRVGWGWKVAVDYKETRVSGKDGFVEMDLSCLYVHPDAKEYSVALVFEMDGIYSPPSEPVQLPLDTAKLFQGKGAT